MMRRARACVVGVSAAGLIAASAALADASAGLVPTSTGEDKVVQEVDEKDPLIIEARSLQRLEDGLGTLVQSAPGTFTGMRVTSPGSYTVLIRDGADAAAAQAQVAQAVEASGQPSGSAAVAAAPKSRAELTALHAKVDALLNEMTSAGADIVGTGPDIALGKIQIDIESGQDAAEKVLGALVSEVHFVPSAPTRSSGHGGLTLGRYADEAPWWAGDGVYIEGGFICTAGFPVTKNGIRYMMTAGHCVDGINGVDVSAAVNGVNGTWPTGFYSGSSRTYMGHSSQSEFSTGLDSAMISGSYGTQIWIGPTTTTTYWPILGPTPSEPVGTAVCHGGARSGQQCGYTINISPYTWHYASTNCAVKDSYLYNMVKAIGNYSGTDYGDSGGPIYTRSPSGAEAVYVRGTVSGNGCNTDLVYEPFYRTDALFANGGLTVP